MKWVAIFLGLMVGSANAQIITPAASGYQRLYSNGISAGNGADTTRDVMMSYTLAAGQLANVGDVIHVRAGGTLAASTDQKVVSLVVGGTVIAQDNSAAVGGTTWSMDVTMIKTGSNAQSYISLMTVKSGTVAPTSGTLTLTDTGTIAVQVTGQNQTNSVAGSITVQVLTVDYEH